MDDESTEPDETVDALDDESTPEIGNLLPAYFFYYMMSE